MRTFVAVSFDMNNKEKFHSMKFFDINKDMNGNKLLCQNFANLYNSQINSNSNFKIRCKMRITIINGELTNEIINELKNTPYNYFYRRFHHALRNF